MYHCIAYVNYINGQPVNVKYRSCDVSASGYTKCWSQESPTTPCPPYNIDCINPLRIAEENVPRLIVTEGERDVLTCMRRDIRTSSAYPTARQATFPKALRLSAPGWTGCGNW